MSASPKGEYFGPCGVCGGYPGPGGDAYLDGSDVACCLYLDWSKFDGLDLE